MSPALFDRELFLQRLWEMDVALVAAGFPPMSDWWKAEITRFIRSGRQRWVPRVGRRGGKSSSLCRLGVAWSWFGTWEVAPGDEAVVSFVSVNRDESAARLKTIAAILSALGLAHEVRGDDVTLTEGRRATFRTFAATTKSVVGHTSIAIIADECARWESRDVAANPAREVLGSLRPTTATVQHAFEVDSSAPWSSDDYHAEMYEAGDTDHQVVSFAPTWIANPTITEARTHELEPDERTWQREYAAEPGVTVSSALDTADVAACFDREFPRRGHVVDGYGGRGFVCIDASSLRGDTFAWVYGYISGETICVREVGGWDAEKQRNVSMADIVRDISDIAKDNHVRTVYGDQREEAALRSLFAARGIGLTSFAWSEPSKDLAVQLLRRYMRERRLLLPAHAQLRRELVAMKARMSPSGRIRYDHAGDHASCLITLAHAINASEISVGQANGMPVIHCGAPTLLRQEAMEWAALLNGGRTYVAPYTDARLHPNYPNRGHYSD